MKLSSTSNKITQDRNGLSIQAELFDNKGNPLSGTSQTTVNGQSGVFYMSFRLLVSNEGNTILTDVISTEQHPQELSTSLAGQTLQLSTLSVSGDKVLLGETSNQCLNDLDCASNEKCIGTPLKCRIDISNFVGEKVFGFTAKGNWQDALGNIQESTSETINLPLTFAIDGVLCRFEKSKLNAMSLFQNSWIACDWNQDGFLESYGGDSIIQSGGEISCMDRGDFGFIGTYGDYILQRSTNPAEIFLCKPNTVDNYISFRTDDSDASRGNLYLSNEPIEPFYSDYCSGVKPCQEIYMIKVEQPETCSDSIQNQDETDTDCGGLTCSACEDTKSCLINSDCQSNYCENYVCITQTPKGYLNFNGVNSYVKLNKRLMIGVSSYSLSAWIKPERLTGVQEIFDGSAVSYLTMKLNSGKLQLAHYKIGCGASSVIQPSITMQNGNWYHVAGTYNMTSGQMKLYINGQEVASNNVACSPDATYSGIDGFGHDTAYNYPFKGAIDEPMIFKGALSPSEVSALYASGRNIESYTNSNLVSWYPFTDGTAKDKKSTNDGVVINATYIAE